MAQRVLLKIAVGTGYRVATKQLNIALCPIIRQTKLRPSDNRLSGTTAQCGGKNRIQLLEIQPLDRIISMHKNPDRINRHTQCRWLVAVHRFKRGNFTAAHWAAHRAKLRRAF
ncbi:Uncharacterised protein [Vibrio cholerae]|uniref:Uncharacterized protein n=1 Tax=Vibrio cholerae TaxID=666 RepID=A0A655R302_VIBCL|nr:Uncharacterised protein [Vibrio cholerae]CSA83372.1 Uncharacterised protein [Vibrio cholerae]